MYVYIYIFYLHDTFKFAFYQKLITTENRKPLNPSKRIAEKPKQIQRKTQ